ncbi:MAG: N-acetyl-gamma-glutamyl-phosphate reductase [Actinomycetota bacterium]|nr:MAG: N-acetyl-gamma-glutamyl-phosphate reductase [Actinomycetota bacterium]
MANRVRVAVLGASGYTGGELLRLLGAHPGVEVTVLGARQAAGRALGEVHPHLAAGPLAAKALEPLDAEDLPARADVALLALPHGVSATLAPPLLEAGVRTIDLAGDFRLPAGAYPDWYGFEHPSPGWLERAVYGLPELFRDAVREARLVANPGCYPTPVALGLAPLFREGLLEPGPVLVDGKTGLSGAGKDPTEATTYASTQDSVRPYRAPRHQHTPEMERVLALAGADPAPSVTFVPHLVPAVRGVLITCYARAVPGATTETLTDALAAAYAGEPFVRVVPAGAMVDSKRVRGSNVVELQALVDPRTGTAVVAGAVDNLVKGAAGQALQNLNLMLGFDETTALPVAGVYP